MPIRTFIAAVSATTALIFTLFVPAAQAICRGERSKSKRAAAAAMLCLVNYERQRRGIAPVRHDARLARVAGRHARDMVRFSFTGHVSPARGKLVTRVKRARAVNRRKQFWVGENLGWGGSALAIHRAWMRSAIHKQATLYRHFTRAGVGVVRGLPNGSKTRSLTYVVTFAG